jgi:hypothetical protein
MRLAAALLRLAFGLVLFGLLSCHTTHTTHTRGLE